MSWPRFRSCERVSACSGQLNASRPCSTLNDRQIGKLNREREAFLAAERKKHANQREETLDQVICKTIRAQAGKQNFKFE